MHNRRCVFRDNPDLNDPDFFEKVMSVIDKLKADGVSFELISDEASQVTKLHQIAYQAMNDVGAELTLVRNLHDEICYATMSSKQSWISKRARELFHETVSCYSINELIDVCSRRFFDPNMIIALGLLGRKPEAEMIKTISMNLDSALPKVRYCAARAAGITQWQAFVPDLEMTLKMETDPDDREAAEHALAVCMRNSR